MDLTLIPICNEIQHVMDYHRRSSRRCDICQNGCVSYQCINCEYSRCSKCHRDKLAEDDINARLNYVKMKNELRLADIKLKMDGLDNWTAMVKDKEILYVNQLTLCHSYEYPKIDIPDRSPDRSPGISPDTPIETKPKFNDHVRCSFSDIYQMLRGLIPS